MVIATIIFSYTVECNAVSYMYVYCIVRQVSIELLPAASEQSLSESIPDRAKEESTGARGTAELCMLYQYSR